MEHFPVFLDMKGRRAVVLGGEDAASQKLDLLIRAHARPVVVASALDPRIAAWVAAGACAHHPGPFAPECLDGAVLAIAASGEEALDAAFSAAAQARNIPVNVVDRPALSSFIMPAIVDRSPVVVAISTGGTSPTLAQMIRAHIEDMLPQRLGGLARLLGAMRQAVHERIPEPARRREFWRRVVARRVADIGLTGHANTAPRALVRTLRRKQADTSQTNDRRLQG
jgi:uroporphyrin-III C-methyltransferase / precorrin-2 dehydrogenase / sirohydrochlorin ferrochelatase